jgi:hypothetical protein
MKRFIAHYFLGGSNHDSMSADDLSGLGKFVKSRIDDTKKSKGGISICVADNKAKSINPWLWRMESGGKITHGRGKFAKDAIKLFNCNK